MRAVFGWIRSIHIDSFSLIILWLIVINLVAFLSMGNDKRKARRGAWRTPESVLFLQAAIGGSVGSILGMFVFHHKTRKWKFRIGMPLILLIQILLVALLIFHSSQIIFM